MANESVISPRQGHQKVLFIDLEVYALDDAGSPPSGCILKELDSTHAGNRLRVRRDGSYLRCVWRYRACRINVFCRTPHDGLAEGCMLARCTL